MPMIKHVGGRLLSAAGGTLAAATPFTLDSFQIEPIKPGFRGFITDLWAQGERTGANGSGRVEVHSPKMHDDNDGFRARIVGGQVYPLWPAGVAQEVITQDLLKVFLGEEVNANDVNAVALQFYYDQATGSDQRLIGLADFWSRLIYVLTVEVAIPTGAVNGNYSAPVALTPSATVFNNMKPNTDYAWIGLETDVSCLSVTLKGPDTGNVRIGVPGNGVDRLVGREYHLRQSALYQRAMIPTINSAAAPQTFAEVVCTGLAAGPPATIIATFVLGMLRTSGQ